MFRENRKFVLLWILLINICAFAQTQRADKSTIKMRLDYAGVEAIIDALESVTFGGFILYFYQITGQLRKSYC